ncbi:hypothetical protein D9619_000509 [Psilocybe cf. subviscida]|uniref:Uncharacterized protein n=1 Tax=Psilocybe cf. subviscida TaxID=2480587 RepID=A0A8H5BF18_9AGAR|nr:hypothetical protein D9619_000509 [Psilocybe cf. subviscida]
MIVFALCGVIVSAWRMCEQQVVPSPKLEHPFLSQTTMSSLLAASSAVSSPIGSSAAASAAANMASISSPSHEVALVAPRPVRISHAAFFHVQQRDADYSDYAGSGSHLSPGAGIKLAAFSSTPERTSPRSSLPSEALEEFLSILTPSFMRKPRAFPAFDPRHQRSSSLTTTTYGYNRASQPSTSPVASRASPPALQLLQEQLASRGDGARTPPRLDTSHWPFGGGRSQNPILAPRYRQHTILR